MASKRNVRRRQCSGKVRHASQEAAIASVRRRGKSGVLRAYRCCFCGGYHVGHHRGSRVDLPACPRGQKLQ